MTTIAIVGTGPTGLYTFRALVLARTPTAVWLFEKGDTAGVGLPYSPETASKAMLANIASIEIPPVVETYIDWLSALPEAHLRSYGIAPADLNERTFTPRLLLGEYFRDQLAALVTQARDSGIDVQIREQTDIADIRLRDDQLRLYTTENEVDQAFDRVILATGHNFPDSEGSSRRYFPSPWSGLIDAEIPAVRVGIMGTSLSSIDAAMAVANQHGRFRRDGDALMFEADADGLSITLMSRTGVLPEADFYCPIPYAPLEVMTDAAMSMAARDPQPLDAVFALFRDELAQADPDYAESICLADLTADSFSDAYFAKRRAQDPFRWAKKNLDEVEHNKTHKIAVAWRYAILRMHEKIEEIVPVLSPADLERFQDGLKCVLIDNYAAVPPESIRRILALRDAGILSVRALGQDYTLTAEGDRTVIEAEGETLVYDVFIDARGQKALTTADLRFPSLRHALEEAGQEIPEVAWDYSLIGCDDYAGSVTLAAIPFLMHDRPFAQGITVAADIGDAIAKGITTEERRARRRWA